MSNNPSTAMPAPNLISLPRSQTRAADVLQRQCAFSKPECVDATRRLLHLCKAADLPNDIISDGPALDRALWRYEAHWLPLLVALALVAPGGAEAAVKGRHWRGFTRAVDEVRRL